MAYLLIADDDVDYAAAVGCALQSQGHEVAFESDAEKVIGRIQQRRPDAVILDVMFPENDVAGFEVARAIRRTFGKLPVLLLTAVNDSFPLGFGKQDLDATWLPAAGFLEKSVALPLLCEEVAAILAGRAHRNNSKENAPCSSGCSTALAASC